MKTPFFRRPTVNVIRTTRRSWGPVFPAVAIAVLLALNAWATASDEAAAFDLAEAEANRAAAFEAGRRAGREELLRAMEQGGGITACPVVMTQLQQVRP